MNIGFPISPLLAQRTREKWGTRRIRVVNSSGQINTRVGTGNPGYNGNGLAASRTNVAPVSVGVTPNGVVYFSDGESYRVRVVH